MNVSAPTKRKLPWRKIITVGLVLIVVGYNYAQPTLEKWTGVDLPTLNGDRDNHRAPTAGEDRSAGSQDYTVNFPKQSKQKASGGQSTLDGGFQLKEVGRNRFESPAGLLYTMGGGGEHRIEHVMRHSQDMADRPAHGVFIGNGDRDTVLKLIDDAWELAEAKSAKAKYEKSRGNDAWTVNMGRKVGFDGGRKGKKNGGKSLNSIKLILANGNQVITAYPVR
jgi:hypothetical protein